MALAFAETPPVAPRRAHTKKAYFNASAITFKLALSSADATASRRALRLRAAGSAGPATCGMRMPDTFELLMVQVPTNQPTGMITNSFALTTPWCHSTPALFMLCALSADSMATASSMFCKLTVAPGLLLWM